MMNNPTFKIITANFLLIIGFSSGTFYSKDDNEPKNEIVTSGSDFEMIQEVTNEFVTVWIKEDAERCANTYSENALFMVPDQPSYHGRSAIKNRYEKMIKQRNNSTRIEMTETVREVTVLDDWAVIRGASFETKDSQGASGTYKWIILRKNNAMENGNPYGIFLKM